MTIITISWEDIEQEELSEIEQLRDIRTTFVGDPFCFESVSPHDSLDGTNGEAFDLKRAIQDIKQQQQNRTKFGAKSCCFQSSILEVENEMRRCSGLQRNTYAQNNSDEHSETGLEVFTIQNVLKSSRVSRQRKKKAESLVKSGLPRGADRVAVLARKGFKCMRRKLIRVI